MDLNIQLDEEEGRFFAEVDGKECELLFRPRGENQMEYYHTFTPPELRHHGIAGQLVEYGLQFARSQGWKVIPSCGYVASFIAKHPEYSDLT